MLGQAGEPRPGGPGQRSILQPVGDPLPGGGRIALHDAGAALADPAPVVALVDPHRLREDQWKAQRRVEGELGGLGPERVGERHGRVEAVEVLVHGIGAQDLHPGADGPIHAGQVEFLAKTRLHGCADAGHQHQPEPPLLHGAANAGQELAGQLDLGAGATHREGERGRAPLLVPGQRPEEMGELLAVVAPEGPGRIEAHQPRGQVASQREQSAATHQLVGQREAGEGDAVLRDAVAAQPSPRARAGNEVADAGAGGVERRPDPVDVTVGDDAPDVRQAGGGGGDGRRVEGGDERRPGLAQPLHQPPAQIPAHQPVERGHATGRGGEVAVGVERGDVGDRIEHPPEGTAHQRDLRGPAGPLVGGAYPVPDLLLVGTGQRRLVDEGHLRAQRPGDGPGGPDVAVAHVHGRHERLHAVDVGGGGGRRVRGHGGREESTGVAPGARAGSRGAPAAGCRASPRCGGRSPRSRRDRGAGPSPARASAGRG